MKTYKTPLRQLDRARERYARIKAAGGAKYQKLLDDCRLAKRRARAAGKPYAKSKNGGPWKTFICARARLRARKAGLEATITAADLVWPTHCPVLGIELYYPTRNGEGGDWKRPSRASLDRWDNRLGYVPGNVVVISLRANLLKNNATYEELEAVARYARDGYPAVRCPNNRLSDFAA